MGTPIPTEWPDLEDALIYKVTVDRFEPGPDPTPCGNTYWDTKSCCHLGLTIKNWIKGDFQCFNSDLCAGPPFLMDQRIKMIVGPYPGWAECFLAL